MLRQGRAQKANRERYRSLPRSTFTLASSFP
jgi:hypothetical protein